MAGVEQNRYKTNNGCTKHLPQTGISVTQSQRTRLDLLVHLRQGYGNNRCGRHVTKIVQHLTNFDVFLWGFSENFERKLRINYIALLNLFFYLTIFKQVSQYLQRLFFFISTPKRN